MGLLKQTNKQTKKPFPVEYVRSQWLNIPAAGLSFPEIY